MSAIFALPLGGRRMTTSRIRGLGWSCETASRPCAGEYDNRMKRITVSLPDDLVERIKRAAGGEGQVSSYVATALADYQEREGLAQVLEAWRAETPIPDDIRRQVEAELDALGLENASTRRQTG